MNYRFTLLQRAPEQGFWSLEAHIFPNGAVASKSRSELVAFLHDKACDLVHEQFLPDPVVHQPCSFDGVTHIEELEISYELEAPHYYSKDFQLKVLNENVWKQDA